MPYPESCPECGGAFRNTGSHFTARRNEVGRHVLIELGCQATSRRFWWDFTTGELTGEGRPARGVPAETLVTVAASTTNGANGHGGVVTIEPPPVEDVPEVLPVPPTTTTFVDLPPPPASPPALKEAFIRQLQLDRLTLRQMRAWLMADDARRAIEVAAGATEATYERLALILFGADLPLLLGKQAPAPAPPSMSAEERLELQREKARIRARLRRASIKAAKLADG